MKMIFTRKQIQPEKRVTNPSMGISVPLTKKFWSLCYRNKNGLSITREKNIMKWKLIHSSIWHGRISKPLMVGQ
jgi:hypothetical protein